jgi:hypothetical protein
MSKITERLKHVRIDEGYCNICGNFGRLTRDHVPPKSACKPEKMLQKSVVEYFSLSEVRPLDAKIGTTFKTICIKCNNDLLGSLDNEIGKVTKEFTLLLNHYFKGTPFPLNMISFKADVVAFTRAMVGHLLAATSVTDCINPPVDSPFYTPLKQFVLGKNEDIHATHDFYYWFYPHKLQITAQTVGFFNPKLLKNLKVNVCLLSPLSRNLELRHAGKTTQDVRRGSMAGTLINLAWNFVLS